MCKNNTLIILEDNLMVQHLIFLQKKRWLIPLILSLIGFIFYFNHLNNLFSFDDEIVIENVNVQEGLQGIPKIFSEPYMTYKNYKIDYRPIVLSSFAVEKSIHNLNPWYCHLLNLILFIVCGLLIFNSVSHITDKNTIVAFFVSIVFLIHPINTEVVCSLKNRDELLAMMFFLIYFNTILRYFSASKYKFLLIILSLCAIVLASLSKLTIFPLLFLSLIYFLTLRQARSFINILLLSFPLILVVVVRLLSAKFIGGFFRPLSFVEFPLINSDNLIQKILLSFNVFGFYVLQILFPYDKAFYYGYNTIPFDHLNEVGFVGGFVLIILFVWIYKTLKINPKLAVIIILLILHVGIVSNPFFPFVGIVGNRASFALLFFPLLLVGNMLKPVAGEKLKKYFVLLIILTVVCLPIVHFRNMKWKDRITLMENDIHRVPNSAEANYLLAREYHLEAKNVNHDTSLLYQKSAIAFANNSLKIYENSYEANALLVQILIWDPEASVQLNKISETLIKYYPEAYEGYLGKGVIYLRSNNPNLAADQLRSADSLRSHDKSCLYFLSQALWLQKNSDEAIETNSLLRELYPESELPYLNFGSFYAFSNIDLSISNYMMAISKGYKNPQLTSSLREILQSNLYPYTPEQLDSLLNINTSK